MVCDGVQKPFVEVRQLAHGPRQVSLHPAQPVHSMHHVMGSGCTLEKQPRSASPLDFPGLHARMSPAAGRHRARGLEGEHPVQKPRGFFSDTVLEPERTRFCTLNSLMRPLASSAKVSMTPSS